MAYLESFPELQVVSIRECEWYHERRANWQEIEAFLDEHFPGRSEKNQTQTQLWYRVKEGTFFGAVEVNIETPPHLKEKFSEMTPIFKNLETCRT